MSVQLQPSPDPSEPKTSPSQHRQRDRVIAGIALIAIGAVVFLAQIGNRPELAWIVVPVLGLIFLVWGVVARTFGLIIPGGILTGIGAGLYLVIANGVIRSDETTGAIFMLCFAGGWVLISLYRPLTSP